MRRFRSVFLFVGVLLLAGGCARQPLALQQRTPQQYVVDGRGGADSALLHLLAPYKLGVDTQMQVVIGHTDIPLTKAQPESTLGNFVADAQLEAARVLEPKVVAAVANYGGIRISYMAPGAITRGTMYELMPFDNMLTIIDIPGGVLKEFCHAMARKKGWPVSGIRFTIRNGAADSITIGGKPLDEHRVYQLAVNDYIARGGDNCDFLIPLRKRYTSVFLRDALIDYVARLEARRQPLHPVLDNRIRYAE